MGGAVEKLIQVAGDPIGCPANPDFGLALHEFGDIGRQLSQILKSKNGFFCFESALRVFPDCTSIASWGLEEWNSEENWKHSYSGLASGIFCFAEDIFGNQFCMSKNRIALFNAETADVEDFAFSMKEFASKILLDYNFITGYSVARDWQAVYGALGGRERLFPRKFFIFGGDYVLDNLVKLDSLRAMENYGNIARQIGSVADGSNVKLLITPKS